MMNVDMDPAKIQEVRNSIAEGQGILRAGTFNGRRLSTEELFSVRRQVERDMEKIGESRLAGKTVHFVIADVTPEGYGPTEENAGPKGRVGADVCCPRCGAPCENDLRLPGVVCSARCGFETQDFFD